MLRGPMPVNDAFVFHQPTCQKRKEKKNYVGSEALPTSIKEKRVT